MPMSIRQLRDLLLPGLWGTAGQVGTKKNWDLDVSDGDNVYLLSDGGDRVLLLSRKEIDDNTYRELFRPRTIEVMRTGTWH